MWIRFKYNDHGHPDFRELEIPDDLDGYETVPEYLCERQDLGIPTWSERFMIGRIKWEKLTLSDAELKSRKVAKLQASIAYHKAQLEAAEKELRELG